MVSKRQTWWMVAIALSVAIVSCKKPDAPLSLKDENLVLAAIEIQGGLKQLKAASTFSASYQAQLPGAKIKGKLKHKAGATRVEYVTSFGEPVVQVAGTDKCWTKMGRVIIPCREPLREHTARLFGLLEGSWLWPLKERKDRKVKSDSSGLTILGSGGDALGSLLIDMTNYRVTGLKMQTTLGDKSGQLVGSFSEFAKPCGVEFATKREYTFLDKPYLAEKVDGVICEEVADKVFDQPEQIKHGTVLIRHIFNRPLACTKIKGPLTGVSAALAKVASYIEQKDLPPVAGAAYLLHRAGPPRVRRPAKYVTDVCLPVHKKAWVMPKREWKGEFFLHEVWGDEVLAAYGIGDHVKLSEELPKLLITGAKKRKRKPTKSLIQLLHMHPDHYPPEQRVSEMILYLE